MSNSTLFIYLDESGNLDFWKSGTTHFVMSAICTSDPSQNLSMLGRLKYDFLASGINIPNFHASEDVQVVRDKVFASFVNFSILSAQTFWVKKDDVRFTSTEHVKVYRLFGAGFAKWARSLSVEIELVTFVLVFDRGLSVKEQRAFLKATKGIFANLGSAYFVFFHNVHKDFNGQIADYIAWAHFVNLERDERRPLAALPEGLRTAENLFDWLEAAQ